MLLSLLLASAGGGCATDATGERLRALLGSLAATPAEHVPGLLAGLAGEQPRILLNEQPHEGRCSVLCC